MSIPGYRDMDNLWSVTSNALQEANYELTQESLRAGVESIRRQTMYGEGYPVVDWADGPDHWSESEFAPKKESRRLSPVEAWNA